MAEQKLSARKTDAPKGRLPRRLHFPTRNTNPGIEPRLDAAKETMGAKQIDKARRLKPQHPGLNDLMTLNTQAIEAFMGASSSALQGWQAMSGVLMDTARRQFEEGVAALQKVADCQSVSEAYEMQCDVCGSAIEAYFQDTSRLLGLAANMATARWAAWAPGKQPGRHEWSEVATD